MRQSIEVQRGAEERICEFNSENSKKLRPSVYVFIECVMLVTIEAFTDLIKYSAQLRL